MKPSSNTADMTKGSPVRLILTFSIPLIIGNIFQQLYNMVDTVVVGNFVGSNALGAVGACGSISWLFFSLSSGLALGIGIQNFPEGAAISLPLKQEGMPSWKAFVYGSLSGIVEPIFGILVVLIAGGIQPLMPWLLSFAAGAMMYVVVEELIPEAHLGDQSNVGTLGVMGGFLIMMILDVALG